MEEFEKEGYWFLPGDQDNKVHGKIKFSGESMSTLLVSDQLIPLESGESLLFGKEINIIHGLLFDQQISEVTLLDCHQEFSNTYPREILVKTIIIGHHFESIDEIRLAGITARYTLLEEWINRPSLKVHRETDNSNSYLTKVEVEQMLGEPIFLGSLLGCSIHIYNQIPISVTYLQILDFTRTLPSNIHLSDQKGIAIRSDKVLSFKELIDVIFLFNDFLTFCMGEVIHVYSIESVIKASKKNLLSLMK